LHTQKKICLALPCKSIAGNKILFRLSIDKKVKQMFWWNSFARRDENFRAVKYIKQWLIVVWIKRREIFSMGDSIIIIDLLKKISLNYYDEIFYLISSTNIFL
jgi:hypothetical protein